MGWLVRGMNQGAQPHSRSSERMMVQRYSYFLLLAAPQCLPLSPAVTLLLTGQVLFLWVVTMFHGRVLKQLTAFVLGKDQQKLYYGGSHKTVDKELFYP